MKTNLKSILIAILLTVLLIACNEEKKQTQEPLLSVEEIKFANKVGDKVFKDNLMAFDLNKTQSKFPFVIMAPKNCKIEEPSQNIVILKSDEIEYVISPNLSFVTIDLLKEAGKRFDRLLST